MPIVDAVAGAVLLSTKGAESDGETSDMPTAKRAKLDAGAKLVRQSTDAKLWALKSVLKVFATRTETNYAMPWQRKPQRTSSGSAFVINVKGRWILTNAHVTCDATTIHVSEPGNPRKYKAKVLCQSRPSDLSLLTVEDDHFWEGKSSLEQLKFVDPPDLQHSIRVCGYPMGGDQMCVTKGIVSRLTMTRYSHPAIRLLGIQIDAAINPGNSGGPAFAHLQHGEVAGVAFSKLSSGDNVGYVIPRVVVEHFLEEYRRHQAFSGISSPGFRVQITENDQLRQMLGLPQSKSGVTIVDIEPLSKGFGLLQRHDVVMSVDGQEVADDMTVSLRGDERIDFPHIFYSKHIGETVKLRVWRNKAEVEVEYQLQPLHLLVPVLNGIDCRPQYYIIAGMVFVPLSKPYLEHLYGRNWRALVPPSLLQLCSEFRAFEGQQVVCLLQLLASDITFGYSKQTNQRCVACNGVPLRNLRHLVEVVEGCVEDQFLHFELENKTSIILDRKRALDGSHLILKEHSIAHDRSEDLRDNP